MDSKLLFLYQKYLFWKDMEDINRSNYWLKRIEEYNNGNYNNK
jgi:hypothetical protein